MPILIFYRCHYHFPDKAHEDRADLPPPARTIRDETFTLVKVEVLAKLKRELILLVQSEEGIQVELQQLFFAPVGHSY